MGRGSEIPYHKRMFIVELWKDGGKISEIVKKTGVKRSAVRQIIKKWQKCHTVANILKKPRSKVTTEREDRLILSEVKKNPRMSAQKVVLLMENKLKKKISTKTVRRRLHSAKVKGRKPIKKPLLSSRNVAKRLKWAKDHKDWDATDWGRVLWSDESKFCLFGNGACTFVWRKANEALTAKNVQPTVKHGGG